MYLESNILTLKVPSRNKNLRLVIKFRWIIVIFLIVLSHLKIFYLLPSDYLFFSIFILSLLRSSLFIPLYPHFTILSLSFTVFVNFNIVYSSISYSDYTSIVLQQFLLDIYLFFCLNFLLKKYIFHFIVFASNFLVHI